MSSSLQVTKALDPNSYWEITAEVVVGGTLPLDIFIYENTGTNVLGEYMGVCNLEEYQRLQTFTGTAIPKFGNKYVKYPQAKINLDINDDPDRVISEIQDSVKSLSLALSNVEPVTKIISIP
jgi:hypothetical protein